MTVEFKNRIIGSGEEAVDDILFNPANWRVHPKEQQEALKGVLESVGWVQQVIINKRTGHLVDGHLRVQLAGREGQKTVPAIYVDLDENEEGIILASLDPIAGMAKADKDKLEELLGSVESDNSQVEELLKEIANENGIAEELGNVYTANIQAPIYEPKGDKPAIKDLYDDSKTKELIAEIDASSLTEDEKEFLRVSARRHTVLNYKRIAEYYAHSEADIQRLMENSALVIIDFNKAIELGYVKLSEEVAEEYQDEYGDQ